MSEHLLIPVDGSEFSLRAVEYALNIAKKMNLSLVVLNVQPSYNTPNVKRFISEQQITEYQQELFEEAIQEAVALLEKQDVPFTVKLRIGSPSDEIRLEAEETKPMGIIMGSRGLGAVKRTILGSVSYRVLHEMPCPVTIVP